MSNALPIATPPQRILIVDDEELFREATACALQHKGYETYEAADGLAGAEQARRVLPDLIISDINMDRMDGYAMLENLRKDPVTATIPFILMTGMSDNAGMRRGMELGADDYLPKPFTGPQLFSAVEARLAKQHALKQSAEKKLADLRINISLALPHEMITPLNGIYGLAQLLTTDAETLTPAEIVDYGNTILQSAERLHRTVQNFLLFGQLEMQASDPATVGALRAKRTADVDKVIHSRVEQLAGNTIRHKDIALSVASATIAMDPDLLNKLVDEIIDNAIKFSTAGSAITVSGHLNNGRFVLAVQDAGQGMNCEQIASIGAYSQFNRRHQEQQGSGLGLAIARRITELHGGTLSIESQPGEGTAVTIAVPAG